MKEWSFQNRIMLLAILPGFLMSVVLGSFFIYDSNEDLADLLDERALAMVKQLAPICEFGVMTGNIGILQNITTKMLEEKDVRAVSIYNQDVELLAHAGPKMLTEGINTPELTTSQLQLLKTQNSVRVRAPIFAQYLNLSDQFSDQFYAEPSTNQEILGWAEIELSQANTQLTRYQNLASSLGFILITMIVCVGIAFRIGRQLSQPVFQMLSGIRELEDGKLETRIHIEQNSELKTLAGGINALASTLQRTRHEFQQTLEQNTRDMQVTLEEMEIRNHELTLGRKKAIEANQVKSEFLANVSHEIRTPLSGIMGYSDLLVRTRLNDHQADYVNTIRKSSSDLLNIINDILNLSKIDADKLLLEQVDFHLSDVIDHVLVMLGPEVQNKHINLEQELHADVPLSLNGDPLRLQQILTNLIANAVKFTDEGYIKLSTSLIRIDADVAHIKFAIEDTGQGMSPSQIEKLFQAFSQGDSSTSRRFGGTGLGLIISKALVQAMNGDIQVHSQEGQGSTFTFHIQVNLSQDSQTAYPSLGHKTVATCIPAGSHQTLLSQRINSWGLNERQVDVTALETLSSAEVDAIILYCEQEVISNQKDSLQALLDKLQLPTIVLTNSFNATDLMMIATMKGQELSVMSTPYLHSKLYTALEKSLYPNRQEALKPTESTAVAIGTGAPHVLAVDDNNANLKLVITLLEELGIQVLSASSGPEAIAKVHEERIDLIFMDIQMPGMSGLEATKVIRDMPTHGNIPIIALTAHAMADEKEALLQSGMNDYQTKPITQQQLAQMIQKWTGYQAVVPEIPEIAIPAGEESIETSVVKTAESLPVVDLELALSVANYKPQLAINMFNMLMENLENDEERIRDHWETENYPELLEVVHALHGASRYCGVPAFRNALHHFETQLKMDNIQALPDCMRQLTTEIELLKRWSDSHSLEELIHPASTAKA